MKYFNKSLVSVFTDENGQHKVVLPSGEVIPHLVKTVTTNEPGFSIVMIEMVCNVVVTKNDALENYKK